VIEFRDYEPAYREECRAIIASQVGSYLAPGEEKDFDTFLDEIESGADDTYFCVAISEGRVIGCGGVQISGEEANLSWGILRAGELSKGFGRALLEHRLEWVRTNRPMVKVISCHTAPKTEGFFEKFGFVVVRRQANYWGGVLELVVMERTV